MNGNTGVDANSREIAARVSQTFGDPRLNGVACNHYDRNKRCQLFEKGRARANDEDYVRVAPNDFRRQGFGAGRVLLAAVSFDFEVVSLDLPQPPKFSKQGSGTYVFAMGVNGNVAAPKAAGVLALHAKGTAEPS